MKTIVFLCVLGLVLSAPVAEDKDVEKDTAVKVAAADTQVPVKKEVDDEPAVPKFEELAEFKEDEEASEVFVNDDDLNVDDVAVDDEEEYDEEDDTDHADAADEDYNNDESAKEQQEKDVEETTPLKDAPETQEAVKEDASVITKNKEDEKIDIIDLDEILDENKVTEEAKDTPNEE